MGSTRLDVVSSGVDEVMCPMDGLPLLGRRRPNSPVFVATGFGENIFTLGTLAALAVTGQVLGQPAQWTEVYASLRSTVGATPNHVGKAGLR
jgi:glycine/D-amino acid oxidase-like deaminating enzyme